MGLESFFTSHDIYVRHEEMQGTESMHIEIRGQRIELRGVGDLVEIANVCTSLASELMRKDV